MKNLVIIGNGFDLAHGLKTGYNDFLNDSISIQLKNDNELIDKRLLEFVFGDKMSFQEIALEIKQIKSGLGSNDSIKFSNKVFFRLLEFYTTNNWCDIENIYFELLYKQQKNNSINNDLERFNSVQELNNHFEEIKNYLKSYLLRVQKEKVLVKPYQMFFDKFKGQFADRPNTGNSFNTLFLNFNYTNTVSQYLTSNGFIDEQLIHIHGELENEKNKMVFGYAADDAESRSLIDLRENEYLRNIKKYCYNLSDQEEKLANFIKDSHYSAKNFKVFILGHSCGISDKLILNQIFNNPQLSEIYTFYYEHEDSYFNTNVNIDRIMNNDKQSKKIKHFYHCHRMPQYSDSPQQISNFDSYLRTLKFR